MEETWDAIVVGSGFGGSVSALRLSEQGRRVLVLEQGRRISPEDMEAAQSGPTKLLWEPRLGWRGYFRQDVFKHVSIVRGIGVGGGSIVYASVLLHPEDAFFAAEPWSQLGVDWKPELTPHYETAARMLGLVQCPWHGKMDDHLAATARAMGADTSFGPTPLGIYFGERGVRRDDPFFDGRGPARTGCRMCGQCLSGCRFDAKNTLDKNYLHFAEAKGAEIRTEHRVRSIARTSDDGFVLECVHPFDKGVRYAPLRARKVFLAAGVLGTLEILFHSRDEAGSLPEVSDQLGKLVRTNSETIVAIADADPSVDLTEGPAISSHFWANPSTHITLNRFPPAYEFMKYQIGPLVDGTRPGRRAVRTLYSMMRHPIASSRPWRTRDWYKRVTALTVMQDHDSQLQFRWGRSRLPPFSRGLRSVAVPGREAPSFIPEANEAARQFAAVSGGEAGNSLAETLLGTSVTAHILGGCHMGANPAEGVIDTNHEVFGYPGLFVVDGSTVTANVGVNPSLTITALAERCLSKVS